MGFRNLLYVLAAIHSGCADIKALIEVSARYPIASPSDLKNMLIECGCLSAAQAEQAEELTDRVIRQHHGDARAALKASRILFVEPDEAPSSNDDPVSATGAAAAPDSAISAEHRSVEDPDRTMVWQRSAPDDFKSIARSSSTVPETIDSRHSSKDPDVASTMAITAELRGRYTLTRMHGKGGLGQVWLAIDHQLNRKVALKEMRSERQADPQSLQRLIQEAQITGQLEHPNIIPVYELSEGKGQVFYTMRLLQGQTLSDAIRAFHGGSHGKPQGTMQLRHLLQAYIGVCHAVAYAASRGIVHRDLKPGNVMLGDFGEAILLDWGLAKRIVEPERFIESTAGVDANDDVLSKTLDGQVLGTIAYLSPEQASGNLKQIDARTDVYGLGAILFAILTGQPPHARGDGTDSRGTREVLQMIAQEDSPQPRSIARSTPVSLNAICAKAMAKNPSDRYSSASELAEDISRWMADEPVSAYRESWGVRLARWTRRHRAWTQSAAAALVAVTAISVVAALVVNDARRSAEQAWRDEQTALDAERLARKAEKLAKADATRRFHEAQQTVHRSLTGVADVLLYYPGVQQLRSELLMQAAQDLERFASEDSDDLELQLEAGRAMVRLGDVHGLLYKWDEAGEQYRRAAEHFNQLLQREPGNLVIAKEQAICQKQLAFSLSTLGRTAEATDAYADAISSLDSLAARAPDALEVRLAHAAAVFDLGQHQVSAGLTSDAVDTLTGAEATFRELVGKDSNVAHRQGLAATLRLLSQVLARTGHGDEAEAKLKEAMAEYQSLQLMDPSHPNHLEELADCRTTLANMYLVLGREQDSMTLYRGAISDYEVLLKARPDVPLYRESLAVLRRNVAQQLYLDGRCREAYDDALEALREFDALLAESPNVPRYHAGEAASSLTFGQILRNVNDDVLARAAFDKAIKKYAELVDAMPSDQQFKANLAISHISLGRLLEKLGQPEAARQEFKTSADSLEPELIQGARDPYLLDALAWSFSRLADIVHDLGEAKEAEDYYRKSLAIREGLTQQPVYRFNLAWLLTHCHNAALRDPERAATIAGQLIEQQPANARFRTLAGIAHYRANQWEKAADSLNEAEVLQNDDAARLF